MAWIPAMAYLMVFLTAIAGAMDCLAVSISCGITMKGFNRRDALFMALFFGAFQGGMTVLGWLGGMGFAGYIEAVEHWVAFGLLSFIGLHMIRGGMEQKQECRTFNIRRMSVLLMLSVVTSIDALATGVTYALLQVSVLIPAHLMAFLFTIMDSAVGKRLGHYFGNRMEVVGGIILIMLGVRILLELLFFA